MAYFTHRKYTLYKFHPDRCSYVSKAVKTSHSLGGFSSSWMGAFVQREQINHIMTKLISRHRFTCKPRTPGERWCSGSDRITVLHQTSKNVWIVACVESRTD